MNHRSNPKKLYFPPQKNYMFKTLIDFRSCTEKVKTGKILVDNDSFLHEMLLRERGKVPTQEPFL
jgi:hypothetical protein